MILFEFALIHSTKFDSPSLVPRLGKDKRKVYVCLILVFVYANTAWRKTPLVLQFLIWVNSTLVCYMS